MTRRDAGRGRRFGDASGSSAVFGLLVATGVFSVTFVQVLDVSQTQLSEAPRAGEQVDVQSAAFRLAPDLLGNPGRGWYAAACTGAAPEPAAFQPEEVEKIGLAREPCPDAAGSAGFNLSYAKVENLRRAGLGADASNGALDYAEALDGLGLAGPGFHLRTRVSLADAAQRLQGGTTDPHVRPLYIGDYEKLSNGPPPTGLPPIECVATPKEDGADVWILITNDGATAAAFNVKFTLELERRDLEVYKFTPKIEPGVTANVALWVPKSSTWDWKDAAEVEIRVKDYPGRRLGECTVALDDVDLLDTVERYLFVAEYYSLKEHAKHGAVKKKVVYSAYDGRGELHFDPTLAVSAVGLLDGTLPLVEKRWHRNGWKILPPVEETRFHVTLKTLLGKELGHDELLLPEKDGGQYTVRPILERWVPGKAALVEAAYLDALVSRFDPFVRDGDYGHPILPFRAEGDVLPDAKQSLMDHVPSLLLDAQGEPTFAHYNALVVGSNVEHAAMASEHVKGSIEKWVRAGGLLIVLGTHEQSVNWLQPFVHASIRGAEGTAAVAIEDHALLTTPNALKPLRYDDNGKAWDLGGQDAHRFEVVTTHGGATLAASRPGAVDEGRLLLTTFRPYNMTGETGLRPECDPATLEAECEGLRFLQNLLSIAYDDLNLDYGPDPTQGVQVGAVTRLATVYHPRLGDHVEVTAWVWVF